MGLGCGVRLRKIIAYFAREPSSGIGVDKEEARRNNANSPRSLSSNFPEHELLWT
jgi:hypothetical protein